MYLLIEMFKIRRNINILNMHPEMAKEFFKREDDYTKAMTYFVLALTAYEATAEVILTD